MPDTLSGDALNQLTTRIREDARLGRLQLPTLPDVAFKIRRALEDEEQNAYRIARIVQLDPALSARLLQVANSARYLGSTKVSDVREAIARLGLVATRNLAVALSLHHVFRCSQPGLRRYLVDLWKDSCRVAAVANVLAAITPGLKADLALLGGLTHNIGTLPLAPYLQDFPELQRDTDALDLILGRLRSRLGSALLRHWGFDEQLIPIPQEADDWLRDSGSEQPDYVDVVLVSRVHARFGQKGGSAMLRSLGTMPAFQKFPISRLGPDASIQLIQEAQGEIGAMMHLLRGSE